MSVYHFVNPNLRVEMFSEKEGAAEIEGAEFKIGDIGTSTHLYWRLKKIASIACSLFFITFWLQKIAFKSAGEGFSCFPGRDCEMFVGNYCL